LAVGFACLGPTLGGASLRRRWLGLLAYLEAGALLGHVVTQMADVDTAGFIAAVASGLVFGPALAILLGHALAADQPATTT
jgi:hypothetical protein